VTWPAGQTLEAVLARAEHVRKETDRGAVPVRDLNLFVQRDDMLLYFLRNDFPVLLEYVEKLEAVANESWRSPALADLEHFKESAEDKHGRPIGIQLGRT
jgi:hypothetical protein